MIVPAFDGPRVGGCAVSWRTPPVPAGGPRNAYAYAEMALPPRRAALPQPVRRARARFRRLIIPAIGSVTPVGLIVVNIAVFIVKHLAAFRWSITILAFASGMMLNSWMGLKIYRIFQRRFGKHPLASESNQDVVLISGMAVIIAISFVTALFCYLGLSDERTLPNATTFLTGVLAICVPFGLQFVFQRVLGPGTGKEDAETLPPPSTTVLPPPLPPLPPWAQPSAPTPERRR